MNNEAKKEIKKEDIILSENVSLVATIKEENPQEELLGSVTTYSCSEGSDRNQQLRSSARVFKKIKLDSTCPPPAEKIEKKETKEEPKQEHKRPLRPIVSTDDKNWFFEALNEYGKDFESIHAYISQKQKKRSITDNMLITKEQVRHLYYRTWHKISKFLKFAEGVKKVVQELYGLINYGELKKKVGILTHKSCLKLKEMMYNGSVAVRVKGKTLRIKTPMCKALRRLNQLDDKYDELKLPSRILVELRPKDMNSFFKLQNMALNPRVKTVLPLQKRLSTFITCVSKRWRAAELEYIKKMSNPLSENFDDVDSTEGKPENVNSLLSPNLKFSPPREAKIEKPAINLSEYFTTQSISLRAYEERMGIQNLEAIAVWSNQNQKKTSPKTRTDSTIDPLEKSPVKSDTSAPDEKTVNPDSTYPEVSTSNAFYAAVGSPPSPSPVTSDLNEAISTILLLKKQTSDVDLLHDLESMDFAVTPGPSGIDFKSEVLTEIKEEDKVSQSVQQVTKVKNGWSVQNCDTLTIGELYLMFGSDSRIVLEYSWDDNQQSKPEVKEESNSFSVQEDCNVSSDTEEDSKVNEFSRVDNSSSAEITRHFSLSHSLRKLLSVAKLHYRRNVVNCPCGHVCSSKSFTQKKPYEVKHTRTLSGEADEKINLEDGSTDETTVILVNTDELRTNQGGPIDDFLRPQSKPPVQLMAQLDSIQKLKPKYSIRKGRRLRPTQVVVERELVPMMPMSKTMNSSGHQIVRMNIITKNNSSALSANCGGSTVDEATDVEGIECENGTEAVSTSGGVGSEGSGEEKKSNFSIDLTVKDELKNESLPVLLQEQDSAFSRPVTPSGLLKDTDSQWITSEVGDFSLSSFLGHLESPLKTSDDERLSHDVDVQVESLLAESSLDYTAKFADLANKVISDKTK